SSRYRSILSAPPRGRRPLPARSLFQQQEDRLMEYLGALRGDGMLVDAGGVELGGAAYELDAYQMRPGEVVASGEIRMDPEALNSAFGRRDLSLRTDDGRML